MDSSCLYDKGWHAKLINQLVLECNYFDAAKYLYSLRRVSMNEWLATVSCLLALAKTSSTLNTFASLIEVSKGSLIDERAHKVPGLAYSLAGQTFDYEHCLSFLEEVMLRFCFKR